MKTMFKFVAIFMLAFCCKNAVQAFEYKTSNCNDAQAINNQKIDQVITNEQGVFLLVDCNWIRVEGMQASPNGILILQDGIWISLSEIRNRDNTTFGNVQYAGRGMSKMVNLVQILRIIPNEICLVF